MEIKKNPDDKREKIYKLKNIFEISSQKLTKDELINLLKEAADIIRLRVDYTFILILLFYKAYSDKWEKETE
ncbi:MAG: SAM-dependent DNA methyltransferase, partial [candidate division WOR-3 bacterium]|nr:SAM-dependent DNA methyltransferase [candidate division WOR-3 bacterium]